MNQTSDKQEPGKKGYETPKIEVQGRVEDLTQWINGSWGEFFSGDQGGWNPWTPGAS